MADTRDDEPLEPTWPADDPRWRLVQDGVEGLTVDGQPVRPFRPEEHPRGPDDEEFPDRL